MYQMETKVNVNEISVERLISLEKQNAQLQQQVGELKSDKKNLEKKLEEGQKEVRIITGKRIYGKYFDETFESESVETRNLGDVEEIIRKKYQKDVDNKDKSIKELSEKIEDLNRSREIYEKNINNEYDSYRTNVRIEYEKKSRDIEEKLSKLREEYKKLKEDKTDTQETEKRAKEIIDLKNRIKELEKAIENLTSMNIFKRIWNSIINKSARVEAQKELIKQEKEIEKIKIPVEPKNYWSDMLNSMYNWRF